jgi:uncharacterized protein (DUF2236 family)
VTDLGEDSYYFPPRRSMLRRVHGERSVGLLYGQRALLVGALEPKTYSATMLSTRSADRPFERLARTAKIQETIFLGTRTEADAALAEVNRRHRRINGTFTEAAGPHPAGTSYSALDPELMLWTLAVIADSGREIYETLVAELGEEEREALWQDYRRFGGLLGLDHDDMPASHREFGRWWQDKLASPALQPTEHALELAPLLALEQPVPLLARGNLAVQNQIIKGTLAPRVREVFEIRWSQLDEAAFRSISFAHRRAHSHLPRRLRRGRNDLLFDLVARGESRRGGTPIPKFSPRAL